MAAPVMVNRTYKNTDAAHTEFVHACHYNGESPSDVTRELLAGYVRATKRRQEADARLGPVRVSSSG